jgi:hypothetical protein
VDCRDRSANINVGVALLSLLHAAPREGHLEEIFHLFAYLKAHYRSSLLFDPRPFVNDPSQFTQPDWLEFYTGVGEALPLDIQEPRRNEGEVTCYVGADYAGCRVTRRSHTGIQLILRRAPLIWYSKRHNTIEASTFGSECIAMKTAIEQIDLLRYKLQMLGIPINCLTSVYTDNQSVFKKATSPESVLKKKHNSIAYHQTREAHASKTVQVAMEPCDTNRSDKLTKLMPGENDSPLVLGHSKMDDLVF